MIEMLYLTILRTCSKLALVSLTGLKMSLTLMLIVCFLLSRRMARQQGLVRMFAMW